MPPLTIRQLSEANPKKPFDLRFSLNAIEWNAISIPITLPTPIKMTFNDQIRLNMQSNVKYKKGIYIFAIEHLFPLNLSLSYTIYIGRVTSNNTFFKRFLEYVKAIGSIGAKRNRQIMTNCWPINTNVYFFDLIDDAQIKIIEKTLIDAIVPPLNNQFYSDHARNSRSIYN